MKFKRAIQRYGRTPEPETPYQRAGQVWDERIGSARVQAHNWRLMAFGGLLLSSGLAAALVWQSLQSRVVPYVVAVDRLGQAQAVSPADRAYRPTDPQIAWFLGRFITNVRGRSLDPVLMREDWLAAYDFVTTRGSLFLNDYARAANPFADVGDATVAVQVTSVVRASDTSFQVKWIEQSYGRGSLVSTAHWTAMVTVQTKPPASAETLRKNPLGLYVDAIAWSRELETAPDRLGAATAGAVQAPAARPAMVPQSQPAVPGGVAPVQP